MTSSRRTTRTDALACSTEDNRLHLYPPSRRILHPFTLDLLFPLAGPFSFNPCPSLSFQAQRFSYRHIIMRASLVVVLLALAAQAAPVKRQQVISPEDVAAADASGGDAAAATAAVNASETMPGSGEAAASPTPSSTSAASSSAEPAATTAASAEGAAPTAAAGAASADLTVVKVCFTAPTTSPGSPLIAVRCTG